ncbi:hypothetical protein [Spirosoma endbachense]|uniref:DUF2214 family protein n=1 Tax=Spirosoma endbachense TaxID=2666025 RepID=A0A6P1VQG9_9BACT|nr:hypothetical protein [Spirosoma endbachense]QHV93947.1 DUF2214 family protein [Spirosoma endbachense]
MASQMVYYGFLVLHLTGFVLFAGTTIVDFVAYRQFWKLFGKDKSQAIVISQVLAKFPVLMGIGIILLILSGVGMMAMTNGVFGEQLWFRLKFGLVIILIANGLLVGRREGVMLRRILAESNIELTEAIKKRKRNLTLFYPIQFTLFFTILLLSVFKLT